MERGNISAFLFDNIGSFMIVFIVIVFTIIYWLQSNVLLGNMRGTDGRHTILSILQLFFLLIFLVSLRLHIELGASNETRVLRSTAAALVGIVGSWGWAYAAKNNRLLIPEVTKEYAYQLRYRILAEPITAIITIPMAFFGPILWEISWFSYPVVVFLLKKLTRWKMAKANVTSTIFLIFFLVCSLTGNSFGNEISSSPYSGSVSTGSANFSDNSDFAAPPDSSGSMPAGLTRFD
jgi:hypothetical protein